MIWLLIIGLLFDGLISNFITFSLTNINMFYPFLTVTALAIVYPYFKGKNKDYLIAVLIVSLIFGLLNSHILLLYTLIFFILGILIIIVFKYLSNTPIVTTLLSLLVLVIYLSLTFLILNVIGYHNLKIIYLFKVIIRTIPINVLYSLTFYIILDILTKKKIISRID